MNDITLESLMNEPEATLEMKKKYHVLYEGEKTEPNYFEYLFKYRKTIGIDALVEIKNIERSKIDYQNTDISSMIDITEGYKIMSKEGKYTAFQLATEIVCRLYREEIKREYDYTRCIDSKKDRLLRFKEKRNVLYNTIISSKKEGKEKVRVVDKNNLVIDMDKAIKWCNQKLSNTGKKIGNLGKLTNYIQHPSLNDDVYCIIHDRDYSENYYNDSKYLRSLNRLKEPKYSNFRLVITHPQFEMWLLLHNKKYTFSPDFAHYKDPEEKFKAYKDELELQYLRTYQVSIKDDKKIDDHTFVNRYLHHIKDAIMRSDDKLYVNELTSLCSYPGTTMGDLLREMMSTNNIH